MVPVRRTVLHCSGQTDYFYFPIPKASDDGLHIYFSFGHIQMMTDAMSPAGMSIWQTPRNGLLSGRAAWNRW